MITQKKMSKAKSKSSNKVLTSDSSLEKRIERYQQLLKEAGDITQLTLGAELVFSKQGIVPRITIVDLKPEEKDVESKEAAEPKTV